ncbi:microcystin degradation protein MlrC [Microvirga vignae]|uniref:Microcystinase C n=1 Tax=Microvirga vignae TaxID=1225564 RepID=A0A0H1R3K5_9HYPH|nr:M81 family metallopeptidase [Microvirga vignae]KLK89723.1 microcystin degradation protein MlrC [Microvirga vignae]
MSFRVLSAQIMHESNSFSVRLTSLDQFADLILLHGEEALNALDGTNTEVAGFLDVAREKSWELVHVISAHANPAGCVTEDAFEAITKVVEEAARRERDRLDGILLAFHGAMVTTHSHDGEGEILERLRTIVGRDIPIAATLDLHANVTRRMCELADILVSYKTYPHIDMRIAGRHAGELLHRTMAGEIKPHTLFVRPPMLEDANGGRTDVGPLVALMDRASAYESEPNVLAVSVNGAFPYADIDEIGPTITVTYTGDPEPHRQFAEEMAKSMWDMRHDLVNRFLSPEEAVTSALTGDDRPVVIADYADNPGAGGYGDATNLLRALIAADSDACLCPIVDPETALQLQGATPGDRVSIRLGGKVNSSFGGEPLELTATLLSVSDGSYTCDGPMYAGMRMSFGPTAVIQVGRVQVVVVTKLHQCHDLQQFLAFGIDPRAKKIVAVKSMQHFRAAFEPIASRVLVCDSGALASPDLTNFTFHHVPRPVYPLDSGTPYDPEVFVRNLSSEKSVLGNPA